MSDISIEPPVTRFKPTLRRPKLVKSSSAEYEDFFQNGAVPLHLVGADGSILRANQAELDLLGYKADEYVGRHIAEFHADKNVIADILSRLTAGEKLERYPARLLAKDGSIKHVEITSTVNRRNGRFINTRCFSFDVTALRQAEHAVKEREIRLQQVLDALPAAVYTTDATGKVTYFNPAAEALAGRTPNIGADEWCVSWRLRDSEGNPLRLEDCPMAVALKENRPVRGVQAFAERPDGSLVPFSPYPTPLYDASGVLSGAVNMLIDLTDQKAREAHIEFIMRELSHRSKNLLAIVQAIAVRSIRNSERFEDFELKFLARIQSMARAHDIMVRNQWAGASIREIIDIEVTTYDDDQLKRIAVRGESIMLSATAAQNVGLAVHELATNATKYGALSTETGQVELSWRVDGEHLHFEWQEVGGRMPKHDSIGFGTEMLRGIFKDAVFDFKPSGLRFTGVMTLYTPKY